MISLAPACYHHQGKPFVQKVRETETIKGCISPVSSLPQRSPSISSFLHLLSLITLQSFLWIDNPTLYVGHFMILAYMSFVLQMYYSCYNICTNSSLCLYLLNPVFWSRGNNHALLQCFGWIFIVWVYDRSSTLKHQLSHRKRWSLPFAQQRCRNRWPSRCSIEQEGMVCVQPTQSNN